MFKVIEGKARTDGVEGVRSFGIKTPSGAITEDITTKKESLVYFVQVLNHNSVSKVHFMDLVYDFIG